MYKCTKYKNNVQNVPMYEVQEQCTKYKKNVKMYQCTKYKNNVQSTRTMYKVQEQCKNVPMYKVQEQCTKCTNVQSTRTMYKVQEKCTKCVREPSNLLMLGRGGLSQLPPDIVSGKLII